MRPVNSKYPVTLGYRQKAKFNPNYIHRGIDYGCPSGTSVVATTGGVVIYAADARRASAGSYGPAYGIQVIVKVNSVYCLYAHLSRVLVKKGQSVTPGQIIGRSGATGNVRGAHLHYQENTKPPGAYTSDRRPQFISAPAAKPTIKPVDKRGAWVVDTETLNGRDFPHPDFGKVITSQHRGKRISTSKEVLVDGTYWNYREADKAWYSQTYLKRTYFPENVERKSYIVVVGTANVRNAPMGKILKTLSKDDVFEAVGWETYNGAKWLVNSRYEWTAASNVKELIKTIAEIPAPPEPPKIEPAPNPKPTPTEPSSSNSWMDKFIDWIVRIKF
jgi:hypothetical protein